MSSAGTIILAVLFLVAIYFLVSAGFWLVRRLDSRPCPVCGSRVPTGQLDCEACGFDFTDAQTDARDR